MLNVIIVIYLLVCGNLIAKELGLLLEYGEILKMPKYIVQMTIEEIEEEGIAQTYTATEHEISSIIIKACEEYYFSVSNLSLKKIKEEGD
jgi:hypothetical protein